MGAINALRDHDAIEATRISRKRGAKPETDRTIRQNQTLDPDR